MPTAVSRPSAVKIFIADLPERLQPLSAPFVYPPGSSDWGVEQEAHQFFRYSYPGRVLDPRDADWIYLAPYWTRIHLWNDYGRNGVERLEADIGEILGGLHAPTFTVCQYDDGPLVNLAATRIYLSSRKSNTGYDLPLLTYPPPRSSILTPKRYFASFLGRFDTHPTRGDALKIVSARADCLIADGLVSPKAYRKVLRESWVALAPRGYGGSSFRFYEAVFAGAVPWLIGDIDSRPFKSQIDWSRYSFYSENVESFEKDFSQLTLDVVKDKHRELGRLRPLLRSQQWCQLLANDLARTQP